MTNYIKPVVIDVNAVNNYTCVKVKQGDSIHRKLAVILMEDGQYFTINGYSIVQFRCEKPDGSIVVISSTDMGAPITVFGNACLITLSSQCLAVAGKAWCDVAFLDSSRNTLSSASFILNIIPMPNITSRVVSSDDWAELQQAIDDAERFANILDFRTSGQYIQYTVDGTTWKNLCQLSEIVGTINAGEIAYSGSATYANDTVGKQLQDVSSGLSGKAPVDSPTFTGTPKSVTPSTADDSTKIATTAFVKANLPSAPTAETVPYDGTLGSHTAGSVGEKLKSLDDGVSGLSGTVPITRGGTGGTTVSAAKTNLGLSDLMVGSIALPKNATTRINIPSNSIGVMFLTGNDGLILIVSCSSNNAGRVVSYKEIGTSSVYTFTTDTGELDVANGSTANTLALWLEFTGKTYTEYSS